MNGPNLFLLCAPRSGSTQMVHWLNSHPDISASAIKEPTYFGHQGLADAPARFRDVPPHRAIGKPALRYQFTITTRLDDYRALFAPLSARYALDASTATLTAPNAAQDIKRLFPTSRFIAITRNPLERAISHYKLARRMGRARHSLGQEVHRELKTPLPEFEQYLLRFRHAQSAMATFEHAFGKKAILHIAFEEMVANPGAVLSQCARFLEIEDSFDLTIKAQNQGALPRFEGINHWAEEYGIKTQLRRFLPNALKPILRRAWFKPRWDEVINDQDIMALAKALKAP